MVQGESFESANLRRQAENDVFGGSSTFGQVDKETLHSLMFHIVEPQYALTRMLQAINLR